MPKYRKKPVVIEAYQAQERLEIKTLEGTMVAEPNDFIITGVRREKYPCKPDIFHATYVREFEPESPDEYEHHDLVEEYLEEYPLLKPVVEKAQQEAKRLFPDMGTELVVLTLHDEETIWELKLNIICKEPYSKGLRDRLSAMDDAMMFADKHVPPDYDGEFMWDIRFVGEKSKG